MTFQTGKSSRRVFASMAHRSIAPTFDVDVIRDAIGTRVTFTVELFSRELFLAVWWPKG